MRTDVHAPKNKRTENYEFLGCCEWFALCTNKAIVTTSHPILGDVPICERCMSWLTSIDPNKANETKEITDCTSS